MDKIGKIIKANLSDKSDMPEWYQKRLDICSSCPLNSVNYNVQTIPEKTRFAMLTALNTGSPFCWECGCKISAKTSLPESECGGNPSRWRSVSEVKEISWDKVDYTVENLSTDKVEISFLRGEVLVEYGEIEERSNTEVSILIKPKTEEDFINLKVSSECGCTAMDPVREGRNIRLNINYDSKRIGEFSKLVTLDYISNKSNQLKVRIKGEVNQIIRQNEL